MLRFDRKVAKAVKKLTHTYDDVIYYSSGNILKLVQDAGAETKVVSIHVPSVEIPGSIKRLHDAGYLSIRHVFLGEYYFSITPKLRHRFAFLLEEAKQNFWAGFISGLATAAAAIVLGPFALSALSLLSRQLSRLISFLQ